MDVKLLRESTRAEHEAVEAAVPLVGPDLTRAGYVDMLDRFAGVILAWDTVAEAHAPPACKALVQERRRSEALDKDLRFFGRLATQPSPKPLLDSMVEIVTAGTADVMPGSFLGAMYVVEGSTLGGQYIAHHVEAALGLQPGEGDSFFRGYGKETMPKWREFQEVLQQLADTEADRVIAAARQMFGIFQAWLAPGSHPHAAAQNKLPVGRFAASQGTQV